MFRFRGKRKDNKEWVVGCLSDVLYHTASNTTNEYVIELNGSSFRVYQSSLSISIGKLDSKKDEIFASFPVNGVMTDGGDLVRFDIGNDSYDYAIKYSEEDGAFIASGYGNQTWQYVHEFFEFPKHIVTIIGKQGG